MGGVAEPTSGVVFTHSFIATIVICHLAPRERGVRFDTREVLCCVFVGLVFVGKGVKEFLFDDFLCSVLFSPGSRIFSSRRNQSKISCAMETDFDVFIELEDGDW